MGPRNFVRVARAVGGALDRAADRREKVRLEREREGLLARERAARQAAEKAREEADSARRAAEAANRAKDEFLATVSHELRTPLNAILGWATMLASHEMSPGEVEQGHQTILRNAKAQAQLVNDLLDLSRIVTGRMRIEPQPVRLAAVVEQAMESVRLAAEAKGIRVVMRLDRSLGPVRGDPDRLRQVFWNLLANAVKFTGDGGRVEVTLEGAASRARLTVADDGIGIAPDFLPFVFDRFRQADSGTSRRYGGLGLGLSIVKHLVEMHGGTVRAESAGEGKGAVFTVELPLMAVVEGGAPGTSAPAADGLPLRGLKVLMVDDEADARILVSIVLGKHGAEVETAPSADDALAVIPRFLPDVLVSDIGLGGDDGYSFIRRVRELGPERGGDVRALALTSYAQEADRRKAIEAGFQMHLPKPADPAELARAVAALAGRSPTRP
jgi:signal transduction histidine kinase/ActR/RegA family two-component response regulator